MLVACMMFFDQTAALSQARHSWARVLQQLYVFEYFYYYYFTGSGPSLIALFGAQPGL
jgi:hypothetical protein